MRLSSEENRRRVSPNGEGGVLFDLRKIACILPAYAVFSDEQTVTEAPLLFAETIQSVHISVTKFQ